MKRIREDIDELLAVAFDRGSKKTNQIESSAEPGRSFRVTIGSLANRPKFTIGQVVHHARFGYRGVVVDIDLTFSLSEQWYDQVAKSRPPKDAPWYRVLVGGAVHETYVAERNLEEDNEGTPIEHPRLAEFFDAFENGHYVRRRSLN